MVKVGITGGIGGGKSTASEILMVMGFPVYNSDVKAKELMNSDPVLIEQISELFGKDIYTKNGLDRAALSKKVFSSKLLLKKLEQIVHPAVNKDFNQWALAQSSRIVFKEAAILFETGAYKELDYTICVTAPENERVKRVMKRDGLTEEQVKARMLNQWPDQEKCRLADYVLHSDDQHIVIKQLLNIIGDIEQR